MAGAGAEVNATVQRLLADLVAVDGGAAFDGLLGFSTGAISENIPPDFLLEETFNGLITGEQ